MTLKSNLKNYLSRIFANNQSGEFNRVRKAIFNSPQIAALLKDNGVNQTYEISSGTSDRPGFSPYLTQITQDLKRGRYYHSYFPTQGNLTARKSLAFMESLKLSNLKAYTETDICLTTGTTDAITLVFEYLKQTCPEGEVIIPVPNYYVFKFAATSLNLRFKEVISFSSIDSIVDNITPATKMIILVNPTNPTGQIYSPQDVKKLLIVAKQKNILILADEIFSELIFDPDQFIATDKLASEINALENLVVVKGYSKSKNLPALRIGYLFSKNTQLIQAVEKILELHQCFALASAYTGLISLDSYLQSVNQLVQKGSNRLSQILATLKSEFKFSDTIQEKSLTDLSQLYFKYQKYLQQTLKVYSQTFDQSMDLLNPDLDTSLPKQAAFNTFVKVKDLNKINLFDFTLNLYLATGVKIELGPCFGLTQKDWETNPQLGFWLRVTFAKNKSQLLTGIKKFIQFKRNYLPNPSKFLQTNLSF